MSDVSPSDFKAALSRFASGVTVVTAKDAEGDHGMTASAFSSLSLDPPLVLVCVGRKARMHAILSEAGSFAINILAEDQTSVSNRFAGWWEEGRSKWADLSVAPAPKTGAAWIGGALANLDCHVHATYDGGDHTLFVGRVVAARVPDNSDPAPLLYFSGSYRNLSPR